MDNPTNGGRRGRHRRRWTATGLLVGVPAVVVPYRLVSMRSGKVLDVNGFSTADGTRIQQWTDQNTANQRTDSSSTSQEWRISEVSGSDAVTLTSPRERPRPGHLRKLHGRGRGGRPVSEISAPAPTPCSAATTSVNRP